MNAPPSEPPTSPPSGSPPHTASKSTLKTKNASSTQTLEHRLSQLQERGVVLIDPRQVWLDDDVDLQRICANAILYPGTRVQGSRTWIGPGAEVGKEGPATIVNAQLDTNTRIDSGMLSGSVLLQGASLGTNAHVRPGCLLEEQVSTAHCVGLKQTILLSFVTLGSLINFCDCLMAGGRSRNDHAEVGSGYIHFNFTPWGESGDKATPSLIGDVPRGVFLDQDRIFLGGLGGMVGPRSIGYGSVVGAGQVLRKDVESRRLVLSPLKAIDRPCQFDQLDAIEPRTAKNIEYIANLHALRSWYQQLRMPLESNRSSDSDAVLEGALTVLNHVIAERHIQLQRFLQERGKSLGGFPELNAPACPGSLQTTDSKSSHVEWVSSLAQDQIDQGCNWLQAIVNLVKDVYQEQLA